MAEEEVRFEYDGLRLTDILFGMPTFGNDDRDRWLKALIRRLEEFLSKIPSRGYYTPGGPGELVRGDLLFEASADNSTDMDLDAFTWMSGIEPRYRATDWVIVQDNNGLSYIDEGDGHLYLDGYEGPHDVEIHIEHGESPLLAHYGPGLYRDDSEWFVSGSFYGFGSTVTVSSMRGLNAYAQQLKFFWGALPEEPDVPPIFFRIKIWELVPE